MPTCYTEVDGSEGGHLRAFASYSRRDISRDTNSEARDMTAGQAIMTPLERQPQGYLAYPEVTTGHYPLLSERKGTTSMVPSTPLACPVVAKPFPTCFKVVTELSYMHTRRNDRDRLHSGMPITDAPANVRMNMGHIASVFETICPCTSTIAVTEYLPLFLEMSD